MRVILLGLGLVMLAWWGQRVRGFALVIMQVAASLLLAELGVGLLQSEAPEARVPVAWTSVRLEIEDFRTVNVPRTLFEPTVLERGDAVSVLYIGDSFTAGQGVEPGEAFPDVVHARLVAEGHQVQTVNHGVAGTSFWEQTAIFDGVSSAHSPDVVVWTWLINDLGVPRVGDAPILDDGVVDRRPPDASPSKLLQLLGNVYAARQQTAAMIDSYRSTHDPDRNGEVLARVEAMLQERIARVTSRGGRFVFAVHPLLFRLDDYPFQQAHREILDRARAAGAEVIDLYPAFEGLDAASLWATDRDHHPNTEGYQIAGEAIAEALLVGPLGRSERVCGEEPTALGLQTLAAYRCHHPRDLRAPLTMAREWARSEASPGRPFNRDRLAVIGLAEATLLADDPESERLVSEVRREVGALLGR